MPLNLDDAEKLKRTLIDPVIEGVGAKLTLAINQHGQEMRSRMAVLEEQQKEENEQLNRIEKRLNAVERFKAKIAMVASVIAIVAGIAWRAVLDWAETKFTGRH